MHHLYLLSHFPCFFLVKVGISQNVKGRQARIDKSLRFGRTFLLCSVRLPGAKHWEAVILEMFAWCRCNWLGGSGRTEWFFFFPVLIVVPFVVVARLFKWALLGGAVVLLLKWLQVC